MIEKRHFRSLLRLTLSAAFVAAAGGVALADQSHFGCSHLESNPVLPSVEGKDGFFFRIFADLRMQHTMTDQTADQLAQLSAALKSHGTTLIYVPIPTKSMTLSKFLPDNAYLYGFDETAASAVFEDQVKRLRDRGVVAMDLLTVLKSTDAQNPPFFRSDFHWTSDGARAAAEAIGNTIKAMPDYADATPVQYETVRNGDEMAISGMRRTLQAYCVDSLPPVVTKAYETTEVASADATLDIFGGDAGGGSDGKKGEEIALVGTSFSDAEVPNFGGFLAQYASLPVSNLAITGGNQFGAVASYMTSKAFAESRPRYLIWENPVYNNLAQFGTGAMDELIAASTNKCEALPSKPVANGNPGEIAIDLSNADTSPDKVLLADAGDSGSRDLVLSLQTPDGKTLKHEIHRGPRFLSTGRFYVPLEPFAADKFSDAVFKFDRVNPENVQLSLCSLHQG